MATSAADSINQVYDDLVASLGSSKSTYHAFVRDVEAIRTTLFMPLDTEKVSFSALRDGIKVDTVVHIGERVTAFRSLVEEKQKELAGYWKEWERLQREIVAVGVDTLGMPPTAGDESFGGSVMKSEWRKEKELIDSEWGTQLEELRQEIQSVGQEALKRLTAAEKASTHIKLRWIFLTC